MAAAAALLGAAPRLTAALPPPALLAAQAANDITGYAFDSQPIEWEWTSCANPIPPRVAFRDLAGGQLLVTKARSQG